jgi:hypothetical protein
MKACSISDGVTLETLSARIYEVIRSFLLQRGIEDEDKFLRSWLSSDEDERTLRRWISVLSIVDKIELSIYLGVPSNIPEQQFENLIFNQLLVAASNPEIQKSFQNWSPSILIALAQCGQLRCALSNVTKQPSYDSGIIDSQNSNYASDRESHFLAGALRWSQNSLLSALEESRRLQGALAECEQLRKVAVTERDALGNRVHTLQDENMVLQDRVNDLVEESRRVQM